MTAMTTTLRNRLFLSGLAFGGLFGLLTGTILALQIGPARALSARGTLVRWPLRRRSFDYTTMRV